MTLKHNSVYDMQETIKIIYAQAGKPGINRARYVEQWREHGSLAMSCTDYWQHVETYIQADVLAHATEEAGGDGSYFGVGEICYASRKAKDAGLESPSRANLLLPQGQSIWGHKNPISVHTRSKEWFRRRHGLIKVYVFIKAHQESFKNAQIVWSEAYHEVCRILAGNPFSCSYTKSISLDEDSHLLGVDEFEFDNLNAAVDFLRHYKNNTYANQIHATPLVTEQIALYRRSNYEYHPALAE